MANQILERMARALWENSLLKPYRIYDAKPSMTVPESGPDWQRFIPVARSVLEAMKEPTDAMALAGAHSSQWASAFTTTSEIADEAREVWNAMIDAALNEKGS